MYLLSWLKLMVFTCCVCHRTPHILQPLDVTPHILQPLDITTFKSCKTNFSKACSTYLATNPERVVTTDKLALLVVEAWPSSFTPVNIMSGFKKCGVFLLNPSEVSDRQTAPSKTFCQQNCKTRYCTNRVGESSVLTRKKKHCSGNTTEKGMTLLIMSIMHGFV